MFKFLLYLLVLFALQVAIGLALDLGEVRNAAEVALPVAGVIAAALFLNRDRFRVGLARLRNCSLGDLRTKVETTSVALLALAALLLAACYPSLVPHISVTLLAVVSEEVFLRAVPFLILAATGAWSQTAKVWAVAISSLVFLVGHDFTSVALALDKLIFAVGAAIMLVMTGRLWLGIAVHGVGNLFAAWYFSSFVDASDELYAAVSISATVAALVALGIVHRRRLRRVLGPRRSYNNYRSRER